MAIDREAQQLIDDLIRLVELDEITAKDETSPLINNHFVFTYRGMRFATQYEQDEKPALYIDGREAIRDYTLSKLIHALSERFRKSSPPPSPEIHARALREEAAKHSIVAKTLERLNVKD